MTPLAALSEEWAAVDALVGDLTPEQWLAPTPCPDWDVRDQLAHIVAAEYVLGGRLGTPGATPDAELYASVGMFMVDVREESPSSLLERFREITAERLTTLADLPIEAWDHPTWTPVGPGTVDRLVRLRVFDCWMHEQDIRDAVGRPGHEAGPAVELTLDEIARALPPVLARHAHVPDGAVITLATSGPVARTWHVAVAGGRGRLVEPPDVATATVHLPTGILTRLCGGRIAPAAALATAEIGGDTGVGYRIVNHLAFTR